MIALDTYEDEADANYLKDLLTKNGIKFKENKVETGLQILIDESDESKINEIIKNLD
jgi:hypothetical protein